MPHDTWNRRPSLERLMKQDIWHLRAAFLNRLFPDVKGQQIIEVGSGPAHDSIPFARRGADITALDYSEAGLQLAEQIYADLDLPITTVQGNAMQLPFEDNQFDLAFNGGVLEHFTDAQLESVIDEMSRVVKPGGVVLAFCPNRHNVFYQTHLKRIAKHSYEFERAFTAAEMTARFEARGFQNVQRSGVHVHPAPNYLLPQSMPGIHRIEPLCRKLFAPLERFWGLHHLKSLIGQDFVVWATVPSQAGNRRTIATMTGGPAVRQDGRAAA